jgi:hypothetical protein
MVTVWLEGLGKLKKSNDFIGTRTGDLPACSIIFIFYVFEYFGGVESILDPLGTAAIYWPIVTAPGDCEDGEVSSRRKHDPTPLCPPQIPLD